MVSQVGWIRFDGDEHHDFHYWSPHDRRRLSWLAAQGFLPVYVPDTLDEDLAILALNDGRNINPPETGSDAQQYDGSQEEGNG